MQAACTILDVSESGYYAAKDRPRSERAIRHTWLTELCSEIHTNSRGTYGARRVHAELTLGRGLTVGHNQVELVMRRAGIQGLTGRPAFKRVKNLATAADLVNRDFTADDRDRLWVTDITEHRTREGKLYCCAVLNTYSRRVVGWSIDSAQTATLVTNALSMAIDNRQPDGTIIHSDQGVQFTSWLFTQRIKDAGLTPSMGSIGDCFDNSMIESFWSRMQVELLDRKRWKTRVELATAIFEYIEIFYNRQRHTPRLACSPPLSSKLHRPSPQLENPVTRLHQTQGTSEPPSDPGRFTTCPAASTAACFETSKPPGLHMEASSESATDLASEPTTPCGCYGSAAASTGKINQRHPSEVGYHAQLGRPRCPRRAGPRPADACATAAKTGAVPKHRNSILPGKRKLSTEPGPTLRKVTVMIPEWVLNHSDHEAC